MIGYFAVGYNWINMVIVTGDFDRWMILVLEQDKENYNIDDNTYYDVNYHNEINYCVLP